MAQDQRLAFTGINTHRTVDENLDLDLKGSVGKVTWECEWGDAVALVQSMPTHPEFSFLYRTRATIQRIEGNRASVQIFFEGIQGGESTYGFDGADDTRLYSLEGALSTEPIETHRMFDVFGTYDMNGAIDVNGDPYTGTDPSKEFKAFTGGTVNSTSRRYKKGVTSYLAPSVTLSENRIIAHGSVPSSYVSLRKLGKIDAPPASSVKPELPENADWLLVALTLEQVGRGVRISRSWRASGGNGWDDDIYE